MEDLRGHDGGRWWSVGGKDGKVARTNKSRPLRAARLINAPPNRSNGHYYSQELTSVSGREKSKSMFQKGKRFLRDMKFYRGMKKRKPLPQGIK